MSVHLAATGLLFQKTLGPDETTWLPAMQHDRYRYLPFPLGLQGCGGLQNLGIYSLCSRLSVVAAAVCNPCRSEASEGWQGVCQSIVEHAADIFSTFSGHVAKVCPISLGICKAIDRSGRTKHWPIVLPEATASTPGLLMILIGQATGARPNEDRAIYMELLQELLKDTLGKEWLTVSLVLDPALLEGCLLGPHTA